MGSDMNDRKFILSYMEYNTKHGIESFFADDKIPWVFVKEDDTSYVEIFIDHVGERFVRTATKRSTMIYNQDIISNWDVKIESIKCSFYEYFQAH